MQPEPVADYACQTGESPTWHPLEKRLYWCDIPRGRLFCYDPAAGRHEMCLETEPIGALCVQADGALLLLMADGAVRAWRDGRLETLIDRVHEIVGNRYNDGIADPRGRVFCGVLSTPERTGRLYRLDTDGKLTLVEEGLGTSNGMGFTPDRRQLYHSDSNDRFRRIRLFDYDEANGSLANPRLFLAAAPGDGKPDGLTVDAEGFIWSARWNGGLLIRYAPDGTEDRRITFPVAKVSSVTFGGEDYTDLFVTTAGGNDRDHEGPLAGALFHLNLGIRGVPEFFSRIGLDR
ncbi:MAG TPA: SMP-30/gluconolactonase/LRE family protein [Thermoguttaceae bacterium]|nr:SMP-30/gluconolactonase/LRE family protein [Thermoguttaceae bacterium]